MTSKKSLLFAAAAAAMMMGAAGVAQAQETTTSWKGAPQFSNDGLTFKVRGRVYQDVIFQDVDREAGVDFEAHSTRLRTARLGVEGTWNRDWAYKAEVNFNGGNAQWEDLILEYKPNDMTSIMAGNFKTVSLENLTSSRYTTFMERGPFNDVLDIGRVMNIGAKVNGANWTAAAFVSGDSVNNSDVSGGRETAGVNGRVTFAPVNTDEQKLHLGGWARYRTRGDDADPAAAGVQNFRYRARNNTNYGDRYIDTGSIGVRDTMIGAEAAWVYKNVSLQGEYAMADITRMADQDGEFNAWYVAASWFPTGEQRRYEANKGEFNRVKILNPVTAGGWGAWELGLRYDNVDLTETGVATAGEYSAWTAGVNWYPFPYVRLMANYTQSKNDNPIAGADVDVNTLQFRAQFDF